MKWYSVRRHAHQRHDAERAAQRELRLQRLEAGAGVLHAVEHELGAGVGADARHAGREELEHHRAESLAAGGKAFLDGVLAHARIIGTYFFFFAAAGSTETAMASV